MCKSAFQGSAVIFGMVNENRSGGMMYKYVFQPLATNFSAIRESNLEAWKRNLLFVPSILVAI